LSSNQTRLSALTEALFILTDSSAKINPYFSISGLFQSGKEK